ncbi:MAG: ABC transporter ATP-binding protein [Chloroflexi bacterium]|nr:ABC transporter ATP-binding protein [Chloroflexota bacterium]
MVVEGLVKDYPVATGLHRAVDGVSFQVTEGHFYSLLGPSGCGKTTTLRCVAGLERPDQGSISLGGTVVADGSQALPPERRDIGMVFQSYAIWPHMTVFENAAFPLRVGGAKVGRDELRRRVDEVLAIVGLSDYAGRSATQLSGGQQQRLALARALIRRPRVLLLDEPLSNLDARLRDRMRAEIRDLQRQVGITTLYVTHDQVEALSMSDRIAVMDGGRIVQEGDARSIYAHPATRFVAGFVGTANFLDVVAVGLAETGAMRLRLADGVVEADVPDGMAEGEAATLSVRPENVWLRPIAVEAAPPAGSVTGHVDEVVYMGDTVEVRVRLVEGVVSARMHPSAPPSQGDRVLVELRREDLSVIHERFGMRSAAGADGGPAAGAAAA